MPLTKHRLSEAIDNIRGAVMICYPMGLPEWDFVRQALEATEDLAGTSVSWIGDQRLALKVAVRVQMRRKF